MKTGLFVITGPFRYGRMMVTKKYDVRNRNAAPCDPRRVFRKYTDAHDSVLWVSLGQ